MHVEGALQHYYKSLFCEYPLQQASSWVLPDGLSLIIMDGVLCTLNPEIAKKTKKTKK